MSANTVQGPFCLIAGRDLNEQSPFLYPMVRCTSKPLSSLAEVRVVFRTDFT